MGMLCLLVPGVGMGGSPSGAGAADARTFDLLWSDRTTFDLVWSDTQTTFALVWSDTQTTLDLRWSDTMSVYNSYRFVAGEAITLEAAPETTTSISGWTLRFRVYNLARTTLQATATSGSGLTITSASAGTFTVTVLTATLTGTTLGAGKWFFDLWRTDSGSEKELARGTLEIVA